MEALQTTLAEQIRNQRRPELQMAGASRQRILGRRLVNALRTNLQMTTSTPGRKADKARLPSSSGRRSLVRRSASSCKIRRIKNILPQTASI
jgi:hypothetical protein